MSSENPKFHETFVPILDVLKSGEIIFFNELKKQVRDRHYSHLPEELLTQKTKTGSVLILNRIAWAKTYLKEGAYLVQPERAMMKITQKGLDVLDRG